jgi:conjugal transfer ATP-binding protein TraC
MNLLDFIRPPDAGPRRGDHERLAQREPFSRWLPYLHYDPDHRAFHLGDNTTGYAWDCTPLTFATASALEALNGLLRQDYPADTVVQFLLYPDNRITPLLDRYLRLKTRDDEVSQEAAQRYARHLFAGAGGLEAMGGIPVRSFRLVVAIKSSEALGGARLAMIEEHLQQAGLAPRAFDAGDLMALLRPLFNRDAGVNTRACCNGRPLRSQVIGAGHPVEALPDGRLRLGGRLAACLTPKTLPDTLDALDANQLLGGFRGEADDKSQLTHRFLWTVTILFRVGKDEVTRKASLMMAQRAGGSIAKTIGRRVQELDWVLDDIEKQPYCNLISTLWVFGEDEADLDRGVARATALWEKRGGFVMQREVTPGVAQALLIAALPFGLYAGGSNLATIDRDFAVSTAAAARLLPVQADFAGHMNPVLLLVGRKGQLASLDLFDGAANNYNALVCASTGAGKSFATNFLVSNYYGAGAKIRIVDIGYSYEKQCLIQRGRFIDVGDSKNTLVLNPFQSAGQGDAEDRAGALRSTASIVLLMAYATTGVEGLSETHNTLVKDAVQFADARDGGERGLDHVYEFLSTYPKLAGDSALPGVASLAHEIAFNLRDFCSGGVYGRIFNGPSGFDIRSDEFVVLELERLLGDAALFGVVSMQVINAITQDLYLGDRRTPTFMLFDEAWRYFSSSPLIASIITEGYRRARKYTGSTVIVTQSLLDLLKFGPAGDVIKANSAYKFYMASPDYAEAVTRGVIDYSGLLLDLARSVRSPKPRYSEILLDTPFGAGVGRLCVDRWTYWMNTSSGSEFARFREVLATGLTPLQAITQLAREP